MAATTTTFAAASFAAAFATASTTSARSWPNTYRKAIHEDLVGLKSCICRICRSLSAEPNIHEIFAGNARVWRLVTVYHLAKLLHCPRHADAAMVGHNARGYSHERRHPRTLGGDLKTDTVLGTTFTPVAKAFKLGTPWMCE